MAIYHLTTKPISRSSGRSSTASAAYRAGVEIVDIRTGLKHDYSKRDGVIMALAFDKEMRMIDRNELWNKAESAEKRKDGRTAREWILAIPYELIPKEKHEQKDINKNYGAQVALKFAKELADRYNVAFDIAIHSPDAKGDNRNYHAHIMTTTREVECKSNVIEFGKKTTLELSNTKRKELGLPSSNIEIKDLREKWEIIVNTELESHGIDVRIDHRSLKAQGAEREPTIKMGWKASALERRGVQTDRGDINRAIRADNERIKELELEIYINKGRLSVSRTKQALLLNSKQSSEATESGIMDRYAQWKKSREQVPNSIHQPIQEQEQNAVNSKSEKEDFNKGFSL